MLELGGAVRRVELGHGVGELADVLGCGAAAAADHVHTEVGDEAPLEVHELLGGEVVVHLAVHDGGQPGVGEHRDGDPRVRREVAQVLAHLLGPGRAVDADDVGVHRVERDERGADLGPREHSPGELDRDLGLDRHLAADVAHGVATAVHPGLDPQEVELGLQQQQVDTAAQQASGLLGDLVAQFLVADVAE